MTSLSSWTPSVERWPETSGHSTIQGRAAAADTSSARREPRRVRRGHARANHDQGLIPVKLVAFGRAVNVTLGLPIVRTSVDHGRHSTSRARESRTLGA